MTIEFYVIVFLLGFILVREVFFTVTIRELTNKIMSKSYYEYKVSDSLPSQIPSEKEPKVLDLTEAEDFNSLMF